MSNSSKSPGKISPESFVRLLGAEYQLMQDAGVSGRFYFSAVLIILIMLLTCVSIFYAIMLLFHSPIVEVALSVFFSLLFACIYIFLLNTFSKESSAKKRVLNISDVIRIGFIAFMGFLIAQPLIILLYSTALSPDVANYKQHLVKAHSAKISDLTKAETAKLTDQYQYYSYQKNKFGTSLYNSQLHKIDNRLKEIRNKAAMLENAAQRTIDRASFFLFRIKKVNHSYAISRLLSLLFILLFLLPGYLIYTISGKNEYYLAKKAVERKLITDAYHLFLASYKKLFDIKEDVFSRYQDPPFNTVRKQPPVAAFMSEFVKKYIDKK